MQAERERSFALDTIVDPVLATIANFLVRIGLEVAVGEVSGDTFMKGIGIEDGVLVIDESKVRYPGDLLHEAGHLAMLPAAKRRAAQNFMEDGGGVELSATAWSYAAAIHLGLSPSIPLHDAAYQGGSAALIENYANGGIVGVPLMQRAGMTLDAKRAKELGVAPFPAMARWLCDEGNDEQGNQEEHKC